MARLLYIIPYDPDFLGDGFHVPVLAPICQGALVLSGRVIDYIHYSLVMHQDRRTALYTAHNIDIAQRKSVPRTGWDIDLRVNPAYQTDNSAYSNNPWDRGHLVRRADVAWGTLEEARDASDSTFYYTNAAPQHERFNQDEWVALEDWVLDSAGDISSRLCVFTGPIYTTIDQHFNGTRIPSAFWKVVVLRDPTAHGEDLTTMGFVMKQNELWDNWNGSSTLDLQLYQVGIVDIGNYAGLDFGEVAMLDEFEWRQPRFRDRTRMKPVKIEGPEDIQFLGGERRRARGIRALRVGRTESIRRAARSATNDQPCGCAEDSVALNARVDALADQVGMLSEAMEALLENNRLAGNDLQEIREVRNLFARIVGGMAVHGGEFPECACIGNNGDWFCSGVLVHERVVITAAHCAPVIDRVYLNGNSINLAGVLGEVVQVDRVIVHPDYSDTYIPSHDIAVLILESPAQTKPIEIATMDEVDNEDNVVLVGFGYEHPTQPIGFGTKRRVDVPLTNLKLLNEAEAVQVENVHGYENDYEFHAGRKALGQDSCNGDSGGPSYIMHDLGFKLAGLTSRAAFSSVDPCGDGGIYTRITPYLSWLAEATDGLIGDATVPSDSVTATLVYISASLPNPSGSDQGREWIEITNAGNQSVELDGYSLMDKQGGQHALTDSIASGETRRIVLPNDSRIKLSNSGDEILLLREGKELHRVSYDLAGVGQVLYFQSPEPEVEDPAIPNSLSSIADPC